MDNVQLTTDNDAGAQNRELLPSLSIVHCQLLRRCIPPPSLRPLS